MGIARGIAMNTSRPSTRHSIRRAALVAAAWSSLIAACDGQTSATVDGAAPAEASQTAAAAPDASETGQDLVSKDGANSTDATVDGAAPAEASQTAAATPDASETGEDLVSKDGANSTDATSDADSGACMILASNYDQSCTVDADCAGVHTGDYCSVPTSPYTDLCADSSISVAAIARYNADVSQTPLGQAVLTRRVLRSSCPASAPAPCCRGGACQGGRSACL
jgi:hypothetical protein